MSRRVAGETKAEAMEAALQYILSISTLSPKAPPTLARETLATIESVAKKALTGRGKLTVEMVHESLRQSSKCLEEVRRLFRTGLPGNFPLRRRRGTRRAALAVKP